jgi:hypothetical protein
MALAPTSAPRATADDLHDSSIYKTGFESPTFTAGAQLLGVDGWTIGIPPFLNPAAATVTQLASKSGQQSVQVRGVDMLSSGGITAPYDAVGSYRRPLNYTVSPKRPLVIMEAHLRLETDAPPTDDDFFSMTIAARSGDNLTLGEVGLSSAGFAVAYASNAPPGADPAFTSPIEVNCWHRVGIGIDYSFEPSVVLYFLDGELLGAVPTESTSKILVRGAMVTYALPNGDGKTRSDYTARFDNFRVQEHGAED